jgi:diacylglycerol kinase family enzyme
VTRVRNYGGVMQLVPGIDPFGDALHVLCFRARSRFTWLWLGCLAVCGRLRACRHLEVRATTAVRIDGDAPWQVDGDHGGVGEATIELLPVRASVFVPQPR